MGDKRTHLAVILNPLLLAKAETKSLSQDEPFGARQP